MVGKKSIVLDLDETLIHSLVRSRPDPRLERQSDFHFQLDGDQYYVFKRPGLDSFLQTVFKHFDHIGFWTVGMSTYAKQILKHVLTYPQAQHKKFIFVFTRNKCSRDQVGYCKPLTTVYQYSPKKFTPRTTIMVDNNPVVMRRNPANGILAPDYDKTNLRKDRYLSWLEKQMNSKMGKMTPLNFVKSVNNAGSTMTGLGKN